VEVGGGGIKIIVGKFAPDRDLAELIFRGEGVIVGQFYSKFKGISRIWYRGWPAPATVTFWSCLHNN